MLSLGTFVKYGCEILLGFTSRKLLSLAQAAGVSASDVPLKLLVPTPLSDEMRGLVTDTYSQLCDDLIHAHKEWRSMERRFEKDKLMHGSITEQKQLELDAAKRLFEKLQSTVVGLAECADFDVPELKEEREQQEEVKGISVWEGSAGATAAMGPTDFGPYGDAESKAFYDDLPDLLTLVPLASLGLTPEQAAALRETWKSEGGTEGESTSSGEGQSTDDKEEVSTGADTTNADMDVTGDGEGESENVAHDDGPDDKADEEDDDEDAEEGRDKFDDAPHVSA